MPPLKLEVFETGGSATSATIVMDGSELEETRLAAYEQGYTAGWEDAVSAQADDQSRIRVDLSRNLQALSFTYHEARAHVLRAAGPLFLEMTRHLLPDMAREALAPIVLETLMPLVEELSQAPVTIVLNPTSRPAVEALLAVASGLPFTLLDEPTLGEGQVHLHLGENETRIDLDRATADITAAVRGFFDQTEKERKYG